ncbi:hypothetical protein DDI_0364 [Dickeya dianthicola RNS04.9]|nr:hypothetical protein DDI_0364 [Dickeya dianthicola RNS04.9]
MLQTYSPYNKNLWLSLFGYWFILHTTVNIISLNKTNRKNKNKKEDN